MRKTNNTIVPVPVDENGGEWLSTRNRQKISPPVLRRKPGGRLPVKRAVSSRSRPPLFPLMKENGVQRRTMHQTSMVNFLKPLLAASTSRDSLNGTVSHSTCTPAECEKETIDMYSNIVDMPLESPRKGDATSAGLSAQRSAVASPVPASPRKRSHIGGEAGTRDDDGRGGKKSKKMAAEENSFEYEGQRSARDTDLHEPLRDAGAHEDLRLMPAPLSSSLKRKQTDELTASGCTPGLWKRQRFTHDHSARDTDGTPQSPEVRDDTAKGDGGSAEIHRGPLKRAERTEESDRDSTDSDSQDTIIFEDSLQTPAFLQGSDQIPTQTPTALPCCDQDSLQTPAFLQRSDQIPIHNPASLPDSDQDSLRTSAFLQGSHQILTQTLAAFPGCDQDSLQTPASLQCSSNDSENFISFGGSISMQSEPSSLGFSNSDHSALNQSTRFSQSRRDFSVATLKLDTCLDSTPCRKDCAESKSTAKLQGSYDSSSEEEGSLRLTLSEGNSTHKTDFSASQTVLQVAHTSSSCTVESCFKKMTAVWKGKDDISDEEEEAATSVEEDDEGSSSHPKLTKQPGSFGLSAGMNALACSSSPESDCIEVNNDSWPQETSSLELNLHKNHVNSSQESEDGTVQESETAASAMVSYDSVSRDEDSLHPALSEDDFKLSQKADFSTSQPMEVALISSSYSEETSHRNRTEIRKDNGHNSDDEEEAATYAGVDAARDDGDGGSSSPEPTNERSSVGLLSGMNALNFLSSQESDCIEVDSSAWLKEKSSLESNLYHVNSSLESDDGNVQDTGKSSKSEILPHQKKVKHILKLNMGNLLDSFTEDSTRGSDTEELNRPGVVKGSA